MKHGFWVWPGDERQRRKTLRAVAGDVHLFTLLKAIAKSKDGMSNPEVDETLGNNSDWMTLWTVRQLLALGFVDYKVDLFGEPSRYIVTELGKSVLDIMTRPPRAVAPVPRPETSHST